MKKNEYAMYDYHAWATEKMFAHLLELPEHVYHEKLNSVFPSIYDVWVHLYVIDRGWLAILADRGFKEMTPEAIAALQASTERYTEEATTKGQSVQGMKQLFSELGDEFNKLLASADPEEICAFGAFQASGLSLFSMLRITEPIIAAI